MRLTSIKITNMAAFESFETKLPIVAILQGRNGDGKTSLLDCIKLAFGRGHNEDMIHGNALEGEILIEFDNGAAVKCRAVRERNETIRSWRAPGSKRFVVSREQIDAISNAISYDPLAFLDKTEAEQIEILLRTIAIDCNNQEIAKAAGVAPDQVPSEGNAFDRITALSKSLYAVRRDYNVAADTQTKHAAELEKALPPAAPDGTDWNTEETKLQKKKQEAEAEQKRQLDAIRMALEAVKDEAQKAYLEVVASATKVREQTIEDARAEANKRAGEMKAKDAPVLEKLVADLATAQERARAGAQAEGTRKALEAAKTSAETHRQASAELTQALERLDKLKTEVAARLPIPGITIQDGRIWRDEDGKPVPFARWNTEAKMRFCLRIAVLAHGEAGFICIDNAEHFDKEKRMALVQTASKYAEKDGLQFIIASVSDQPLTISAGE